MGTLVIKRLSKIRLSVEAQWLIFQFTITFVKIFILSRQLETPRIPEVLIKPLNFLKSIKP